MKFIRKENWLVNLAHIIDIRVCDNNLIFTTIDGREEKFVYASEKVLEKLFNAIVGWASYECFAPVFDCDKFLKANEIE